MLGKLIKYDLSSVSRILLPLHGFLILITLMGKGLIMLSRSITFPDLLIVLMILLYVLYAAAVSIVTMVLLIYSFYRSMFSNEGYLTFTLPVSENSLLLSKTIVAWIWGTLNVLILFGCIGILVYQRGLFGDIFSLIGMAQDCFMQEFGVNALGRAIPFVLLTILTGIPMCLIPIYMCFAIGQLFNQHKVAFSFVAFFALSVIKQILGFVALFLLSLVDVEEIFYLETVEAINWFTAYAYISLGISILATLIMYFVTLAIIRKKLNLA
ncbi:MAG: hypothetical protein PUF77_07285 [Clostridiales bacterium]|nr:hypothetical protein [Clostridiales bacterium]